MHHIGTHLLPSMVQTLCACLERIFMDIQPVQKHLQYQKEMDAMDAQKTIVLGCFWIVLVDFGMILRHLRTESKSFPNQSWRVRWAPDHSHCWNPTNPTRRRHRVAGRGASPSEQGQRIPKIYQRTSGGRVFATWLDHWEPCLILLGVFELYHWWEQPCKAALRWTWWTSTNTILLNPLLGANDVIPTNMVRRGQMGLHCCSASKDEFTNHGSARHSNSTNLTQPWAPPEALLRKEPYQIWFTCFFKSFSANLRKTFRELIPWMVSWLLVRVHISCRIFSVCKMWEHDFMMNNTQFLKLPPNQAEWNFKQLIWLLD